MISVLDTEYCNMFCKQEGVFKLQLPTIFVYSDIGLNSGYEEVIIIKINM